MNISSNVVLIPIFHRLTLATNGLALAKSTLDLDTPQIRSHLPRCQGVFLVGLTEAASAADFEWNVAFFSGFTRDVQPTSPIDIANTNMTAAASQGQRSAEYQAVTNFLLESRLQLWWRNPTNVTGVKTAIVSGVIGLRVST